MSNAHKQSFIPASNIVLPVSTTTSFLAHYDITVNDVLRGIEPTQNTTTLLQYDGKYGGGVAIEESTTNLWAGGLSPYNNYGVPATIVQTGEIFLGQPVWRLGMTVDDAHSANLSHFQTSLSGHGVVGGSMNWVSGNSYASSIYWKPVNKMDTVFGGTASNTSGWVAGITTNLPNGWRRYYRYRTGAGVADKVDSVHHSFYCPSLQLNETIYIDVCCPQTELGRIFPTSYVNGTRAFGRLSYPVNFIDTKKGTISFWYKPNYPTASVTTQTDSPKLIQVGSYDGKSSITIWNYINSLRVFVKGPNSAGWAYSTTAVAAPAFTQNLWTMITVTWDDKTWKTYKDGKLVATGTSTESLGAFQGGLIYVGGEGGDGGASGGKCCNGVIDELRIDTVAATDEEVYAWYVSNNPFYPRGVYSIAY